MTFGHGLQGREFAILVGFGSLGLASLASAVELGSNQPSNGEQLGLLVESKCLLAVQMDGQSRDAKDYEVSNIILQLGLDILGLSILTSFCTMDPSLARVITRPATPRSRSNPREN